MDNSNLNSQAPIVNTPVTNTPPPQPAVPQTPTPAAPAGDSNKLIIWLVVGLVVIIVLVGGIYLFLSKQQAASQTLTPSPLTSQPPAPQENLENELNNIDVNAGADSDFTSIDQDLQNL